MNSNEHKKTLYRVIFFGGIASVVSLIVGVFIVPHEFGVYLSIIGVVGITGWGVFGLVYRYWELVKRVHEKSNKR